MKRPPGLTFVAVVAMVLGAAQIIASSGYFNISGLAMLQATWLRGDLTTVSSTAAYAVGAGLLVIGLMGVVFGISARAMKRWAWSLGVLTYLLGIAGAVYSLLITQTGATAATTGVVSALMAWYLSTVEVREAFGHRVTMSGGQRPHAV